MTRLGKGFGLSGLLLCVSTAWAANTTDRVAAIDVLNEQRPRIFPVWTR